MATAAHPCRLENVPWKALGQDEGMLLKLKSGDYYTVNAVGLRIWQLADGTRSEEGIAAALCRSFEIPEETALRDVRDYCRKLEKTGLLAFGAGPGKARSKTKRKGDR